VSTCGGAELTVTCWLPRFQRGVHAHILVGIHVNSCVRELLKAVRLHRDGIRADGHLRQDVRAGGIRRRRADQVLLRLGSDPCFRQSGACGIADCAKDAAGILSGCRTGDDCEKGYSYGRENGARD
jgi:hypothetical protein